MDDITNSNLVKEESPRKSVEASGILRDTNPSLLEPLGHLKHQISSRRCLKCRSRKFRQFAKGKWKCLSCGYEWWNPTFHKPISPKEQRWGGVNSTVSALSSVKNESVGQNSTTDTSLIDYHNVVYKFSIIKNNSEAHLPYQKQMRGWIQEWEEKDSVKFQRTPYSIIIFLNKRVLRDDVGIVEQEVLDTIKLYAKQFMERYAIKLDIDHPEPVRKEVKLLEGFHSAEQFQGKLVKCVYPDGRIEFIDKEKAITHTENFIENLSLENKAADILKAMDGGFDTLAYLMTKQNEILEKVLNVSKPEGLTVKISHIFGLWLAKAKIKTIPSQLLEKVVSKQEGGNKNVAVSE